MATQAIALEIAPAELMRRLPRVPGSFLLDGGTADSWGNGEALLGCEPESVVAIDSTGRLGAHETAGDAVAVGDPFGALEELLRRGSAGAVNGSGPMSGVVCALAYDLGRWIERLPPGPPDDLELPVLVAADHPWVLAYSYADRRYTLRSDRLSERELRGVGSRLDHFAHRPPPENPPAPAQRIDSNLTRAEFLAAVRRVLDYIAAGDVYQVNLAQRFSAAAEIVPADFFARLLRAHPARYAAYLDWGEWALVSNSPECFLRRDGARVATLPLKGTRPRGRTAHDDAAHLADLRGSEKDRAEHVMIVDLERNDLGRVCRAGSVSVPALARVSSLPSLHHLESVVCGTLRGGVGLIDVLRAAFPGGSITGAPKIRAMEIVDEIEPVARRFYTGAIGFASGESWARFNIAIRTAVALRGRVTYHAGGGIVADSIPEREFEETLLKAQAVLTILRSAGTWEHCAASSI